MFSQFTCHSTLQHDIFENTLHILITSFGMQKGILIKLKSINQKMNEYVFLASGLKVRHVLVFSPVLTFT